MLEKKDGTNKLPDIITHNELRMALEPLMRVRADVNEIVDWLLPIYHETKPENEPLTLDELRQMDGEPVWVVTLDGTDEPRWEIVVSAGEHGIDLICVLNGVETRDYADFDLYNDTWLAYRAKPERSEG